jgi:HlyD family secretion protein
MKRFFKIFLYVLIGVIFIGTLVFLYKKSRPEKVVFETVSPTVTNLVKKTVATGSIVPRKEIEIKPQVSGIIDQIYIEPGNMVHKGDLIARIKIIPNMVALNNAESRLNRAKINLEDAKTVYDRQKKVYEQGVIALSDFEKFKVDYDNANEELESAENNLQLIRDGVNKKMGTATNTLIRSTIDGMILDVPVEVGNSVIETNTFNAGTTIAKVADMGEMIFEGNVDETDVGKLKEGMKLILTIGAIENEKFDAVLEYISPEGVSENQAIQFEIKAKVQLRKNLFIRSHYSANADIVLERRDSVLTVPESVIQFQNDTPYVEIEKNPQEFEKRTIKTGLSDGLNIEVISGLTKNDKVKELK